MPKRKPLNPSTINVSLTPVATLPCQSGNRIPDMRQVEVRIRCNFTMPKRKPSISALTPPETMVLQLYHAKAETCPRYRSGNPVAMVATLPCQSGNGRG